jgi:hypothetical protein
VELAASNKMAAFKIGEGAGGEMTDAAQTPLRGDFQWLGAAGAFEPTLEGMASARSYFGLVPEATYIWGTLRDGEGRAHVFMRRLPFDGLTEPPFQEGPRTTIGRRAVLFSPNQAGELDVNPASFASGYNTDVVAERTADSFVWRVEAAGEKRRALLGVYRPDRLEYREDGLIDVAGPSLRPGLQWRLLGRDDGLFWASQTFPCEGTITGMPVKGYLFVEQGYMRPGGVLYALNDVLLGPKTHLTWYSFASEYEDGETQFGHFIVGHDRLGIGVVANQDGIILQSSTVSARTTPAEDGWSARVDLDVDGEAWEVIQPKSLRIIPTAHTPNRQQEGMLRKVGETRKPVRWLAWGETAHGLERAHRYAPFYRPAP